MSCLTASFIAPPTSARCKDSNDVIITSTVTDQVAMVKMKNYKKGIQTADVVLL